jgi:hypothetical protein
MNLSAWVMASPTTADFRLLVMVRENNGTAGATIATLSIDDPNLQVRLRDICQAYRMGAKFGKDDN